MNGLPAAWAASAISVYIGKTSRLRSGGLRNVEVLNPRSSPCLSAPIASCVESCRTALECSSPILRNISSTSSGSSARAYDSPTVPIICDTHSYGPPQTPPTIFAPSGSSAATLSKWLKSIGWLAGGQG